MQCVIQLGDIIDGKCADVERYGGCSSLVEEANSDDDSSKSGVGHRAVEDVLRALNAYTNGRIVHTYGEMSFNLLNSRCTCILSFTECCILNVSICRQP